MKRIPFENDEWEIWRENPITTWLLDEFLVSQANRARDEYIKFAWDKGGNSPVYHASLFSRYEVINQLRELDYTDIEAHFNSEL